MPEEVQFDDVGSNAKRQSVNSNTLPAMFELRTPHWGRLDLDKSGLAGARYCPECWKTITEYRAPKQLVLDESTIDWSQTDFFRFLPTGMLDIYVTRRVIEVARQMKWRDLYFVPLGLPYDVTTRLRHAINPLAKEWPPKEHWD